MQDSRGTRGDVPAFINLGRLLNPRFDVTIARLREHINAVICLRCCRSARMCSYRVSSSGAGR